MWLINAQTLELEHFPDPVAVLYAILSHTWADDEVTFDDMRDLSTAASKAGFPKILESCRMALGHGLLYIWVDTCCIDKSSSAELSEAINSMFLWYKNSVVCFAFLSDLAKGSAITGRDGLHKCKWFTRGWTLQELIAPANLTFIDSSWNVVGTKADLADEVETITGISRGVLDGSTALQSIPLAKRMYWAAARHTTRVEDKAYCLLGIFDVNMPMIYGEGSRAFKRLQEEVLRKTTDLSIFAWEANDRSKSYRGILADSPAEFTNCGNISLSDDQFRFRDEISLTNKGVGIRTAVTYVSQGTYVMDLHCYRETAEEGSKRLGISLKRALDTYFRFMPHETVQSRIPTSGRLPGLIYLASTADEEAARALEAGTTSRRIYLQFPTNKRHYRVHDIKAVPETYWDAHEQYFSIYGFSNFVCFVRFSVTSTVSDLQHEYRTANDETTDFIVVCDMTSGQDFRASLYAQTGLQSSLRSEDFIDPFNNIEQYGPLGDAYSLTILRPGEKEDRRVAIIHKDNRHNYVVSASLSTNLAPSFLVKIDVSPHHLHEGMDRATFTITHHVPLELSTVAYPHQHP